MTKVIHIKNAPPNYKANSEYVYIGRAGKGEEGYFGNPLNLKDCKDRQDCLDKFAKYFYERLEKDEEYYKRINQLKNKILVCFCAPQLCHGDVIAEYLNNLEKSND